MAVSMKGPASLAPAPSGLQVSVPFFCYKSKSYVNVLVEAASTNTHW